MEKFDLIVIGSGPAGEKAAAKAAYFRKKVALIEKESRYGGAGVNTGTLPSKTLKETALYISGKYDKGLFGIDKQFTSAATLEHFMYRKNLIVDWQGEEVRQNLLLHNIRIFHGAASFVDSHIVRIEGKDAGEIYGDYILIATGSYPFQPENIPFDNERVLDSDSILSIKKFPESLCVVGAGVIGCEYATIFATMGTKVFLVNHSKDILPFIDREIASALLGNMKASGIELLFDNSVEKIIKANDNQLKIHLASGAVVETEMFLYAAGRSAATNNLKCENAGLSLGKRGVIDVDPHYRSTVPNIFAAGDVIGFPALASTSMDQGRVAISHMFGLNDLPEIAPELPYGIYTVPEVSMIGLTEEDARKKGIDYCTGSARYSDMPRGKIMGVKEGFLKLIFEKSSNIIIGVHIIGPLASELIHYGMNVVQNKDTLKDILTDVFNYPTLHDLYKYACYDGLGNLSGHKLKK
ncbi:MAG: Si-specific NAD(P)(+) transhydrogenase [Ignavibacteriaceae bacterium]|nr:Si-specific NAD(P)(+) transhydrogenase [Ignavibacteriaceae bacterium]